MSNSDQILRRWKTAGLLAGIVGLVGCAAIYANDAAACLLGYHVAFLFWWRISIGFVALALVRTIVRSHWGNSTWPYMKAGLATLPIVALLAVPMALHIDKIFPWATAAEKHADVDHADRSTSDQSPFNVLAAEVHLTATDASPEHASDGHAADGHAAGEHVADEHGNAFQAKYFKRDFFLARMIGYFAVWGLASVIAYRSGTTTGKAQLPRQYSAYALVVVVAATTFAAFDWGMSLEPEWYSTIYGALMLVSGGVAAMAALILSITNVFRVPRDGGATIGGVMNDLGNLLLAFLMIWTYFAFSQYLIIWSGNLPSEVTWYLNRSEPVWLGLALVLVAAHFLVPFFLLLSRENKRRPRRVARIAAPLLAANLLELVWTIVPSYNAVTPLIIASGIVAVVGIGGLWLYCFAAGLGYALRQENLLVSGKS